MKHKMKKIFENAVWWSGVVMVGLILGVSLQFVRAWTEPMEAPPGGNVGAPINTGGLPQNKSGMLGVGGLITSLLNLGDPVNQPQIGNVLSVESIIPSAVPGGTATAQVAWAAPGGGGSNIGGYTFEIVHYEGESLYQGIGKFNGTLGSGGSGTFSGDLICDPSTVNLWCGRSGYVQCSKDPTLSNFSGEQWRCARYYAYYYASTEGPTSVNASNVNVNDLPITNVKQNW